MRTPKSLGVLTNGDPKCRIQTRLTMTRAVSGFSGEATDRANSNRPLPWVKGFRFGPATIANCCRGTFGP